MTKIIIFNSYLFIILICSLIFILIGILSYNKDFFKKEEIAYLFSILVVQSLLVVGIIYFGVPTICIVVLEGFNIVLFFYLFRRLRDKEFVYLLIIFSVLVMGCFLIQNFNSESSLCCKILIVSIILKYGVFNSLLIIGLGSNKCEEIAGDRSNLLFYILNSKFAFLYYLGILYYKFHELPYVFFSFFGGHKTTGILFIGFLGVMVIISGYLLSKKDLEGYLLSTFSISHFLLVFNSFVNLKLFFYCFFWDMVLIGFFIVMVYLKINFIDLLEFKQLGRFVLFLCLCQNIGVPPFPSFYLEVNFLGVFFIGFGWSFIFLVGACGLLISQVIVFTNLLTKIPYYGSINVMENYNGSVWIGGYLICYNVLWLFFIFIIM